MRPQTIVPVLFLLALPCAAGAAEPQPSRPSSATTRDSRRGPLLALKENVTALNADDAEAREPAQDALIVMGSDFRTEIDAALASAANLEVRTRLTEVLESWAREETFQQMLLDARLPRTQESPAPRQMYAQRPVPQMSSQVAQVSVSVQFDRQTSNDIVEQTEQVQEATIQKQVMVQEWIVSE